MNLVDEEKPWTVDRERRHAGMQVVLHKRTYVLPWVQFLYGEGAPDEVRAVFTLFEVVVKGCGLEPLLDDLADHAVAVLRQPRRMDAFLGGRRTEGSQIVSVDVRHLDRIRTGSGSH